MPVTPTKYPVIILCDADRQLAKIDAIMSDLIVTAEFCCKREQAHMCNRDLGGQ